MCKDKPSLAKAHVVEVKFGENPTLSRNGDTPWNGASPIEIDDVPPPVAKDDRRVEPSARVLCCHEG